MTKETPTPGSSAFLLNRITILVAFIGIFIAGTLSYSHITNSVPPCGPGGGGCADVLRSPYAYIMGIPVAFIGFGAYLALAGLSLLRSVKAGSDWQFLVKVSFGVTAIGVLASFGFTFLSLVFLGHICLWCLGSALAMIALFFLHASLWGKEPPSEPVGFDSLAGVGGLVLAIALTVPSVMAFEQASSGALAGIKVDQITRDGLLPKDQQKIRGRQDAKVFLIEFADANCPACRRAVPTIKSLLGKYPNLGFAFRNLPLTEIPGHETSLQVAIAMEFAAEKDKYVEFYDKVFEEGNTERIKGISGIASIAREVGLDGRLLTQILNSKGGTEADLDRLVDKVAEDLNTAVSYNVRSTPTFIIFADGQGARPVTLSEIERTLTSEPYASLLKE